MRNCILLMLCLSLTACLVGPNYVRPPVKISPKFKEIKGNKLIPPHKGWKIIEPRDQIDRGKWWMIFNDPLLNQLEEELVRCNPSIVNAAANYQQAEAIVSEARASLFPTLVGVYNMIRQAQGSGTTSFTSSSEQTGASTGIATTGLLSRKTIAVSTYAAYLNANWQPDFWGQVRRTIEADEAAAQSSAALWASTRLSLEGSLAQYYFSLRALDRDQKLLDEIVADYRLELKLTTNQYLSGVVDRASVVQAENQLEVAKAQAINNGVLRSQYEHAIAALMGRIPAAFNLPPMPLKSTPPAIPVAVPSTWLERRPDVAEAERLIQQASAAIGVVVSAYYPSINLAGSVSGASTNFGDLISRPVQGWSAGLFLLETIYDGGLRNATVRAARAAYAAQVAAYRQAVLTAFQNVENMLSTLRILEQQGIVENQAAKSAKRLLALTTNQYHAGIVDYASVVSARITAHAAEQTAADVIGLQMTTAVGLVQALGGGWDAKLLQTCHSGVKM